MFVDAVLYRGGVRHLTGPLRDLVDHAAADGGFVWVGLHDPEEDELQTVAETFELHPLAAEDLIKAQQRPKVERYGDWLFVDLRTARYLDEPESVEFGELQLLCNEHAVVVVRRGEPVPLADLRFRLEHDPDGLRAGPVEVIHAIIDEVVDSYQHVLNGLDDDVSEVELDVFTEQAPNQSGRVVSRIYFLQREILQLHRAMQPLIVSMNVLRNDELVAKDHAWDAYFRDVNDHLLREADQLQTLRELIQAALAANSAQVSLRQNDDMRRISAWVAIAAVPTMIAGIYGMNFDNMPELESRIGYPLVLIAMIVVCLGLYRAFRRSGWL